MVGGSELLKQYNGFFLGVASSLFLRNDIIFERRSSGALLGQFFPMLGGSLLLCCRMRACQRSAFLTPVSLGRHQFIVERINLGQQVLFQEFSSSVGGVGINIVAIWQ